MNLLEKWFQHFIGVLLKPQSFFEEVDFQDNYSEPLNFAIITLALAAMINALMGLIGSGSLQIVSRLGTVVEQTISVFLAAGLLHIAVYLFGGRGDYKTLRAVAYGTAVAPLTTVLFEIPVVGIYLGLIGAIYRLYIIFAGISVSHNFSALRTIGAMLLSLAVPFAIVIVALGPAYILSLL